MKEENNRSEHGEKGTHATCDKHLKQYGDTTACCFCAKRDDCDKEESSDWRRGFDSLLTRLLTPSTHAGNPPMKDFEFWYNKKGIEHIGNQIKDFISQEISAAIKRNDCGFDKKSSDCLGCNTLPEDNPFHRHP